MKKVNTKTVVAIMLVALIIGLSPACAVAASTNYQTADPMNVKGKGVDAEAASELTGQLNSVQNTTTNTEASNTTIEATNTTTTETSTTTTDSSTITTESSTTTTESSATTSIETSPIPETGQIMEIIESTDNQTATDITTEINTTGIVMQTTNYTCGPAALATVLNNIGINATEQELVTLAGTDENGTTMYGLAEAAKAKGLNAVGMKLSVDDLKKNNIVFITIDGGSHYSVVREVTVGSVKLADPSLGNIEMSREKFAEVYSGNALVIIDPNAPSQEVSNSTQATGTAEQTSNGADTNSTSVQADNSKILTNEEMQSINGKYWQFLAFVAIGTIIISVRNKYVPKKYWCYCAYHPPFKKVRSYIGKDHKIHYIEYDA